MTAFFHSSAEDRDCEGASLSEFSKLTGYSESQVFELLEVGALTCSPHHNKPTFSWDQVAIHTRKEEAR